VQPFTGEGKLGGDKSESRPAAAITPASGAAGQN